MEDASEAMRIKTREPSLERALAALSREIGLTNWMLEGILYTPNERAIRANARVRRHPMWAGRKVEHGN